MPLLLQKKPAAPAEYLARSQRLMRSVETRLGMQHSKAHDATMQHLSNEPPEKQAFHNLAYISGRMQRYLTAISHGPQDPQTRMRLKSLESESRGLSEDLAHLAQGIRRPTDPAGSMEENYERANKLFEGVSRLILEHPKLGEAYRNPIVQEAEAEMERRRAAIARMLAEKKKELGAKAVTIEKYLERARRLRERVEKKLELAPTPLEIPKNAPPHEQVFRALSHASGNLRYYLEDLENSLTKPDIYQRVAELKGESDALNKLHRRYATGIARLGDPQKELGENYRQTVHLFGKVIRLRREHPEIKKRLPRAKPRAGF